MLGYIWPMGYLVLFRRYSRSKYEVVQNWLTFCMFLDTKFFRGEPPNFWTYIIQIDADTSHVAKFRGDRLTELGDPMAD